MFICTPKLLAESIFTPSSPRLRNHPFQTPRIHETWYTTSLLTSRVVLSKVIPHQHSTLTIGPTGHLLLGHLPSSTSQDLSSEQLLGLSRAAWYNGGRDVSYSLFHSSTWPETTTPLAPRSRPFHLSSWGPHAELSVHVFLYWIRLYVYHSKEN